MARAMVLYDDVQRTKEWRNNKHRRHCSHVIPITSDYHTSRSLLCHVTLPVWFGIGQVHDFLAGAGQSDHGRSRLGDSAVMAQLVCPVRQNCTQSDSLRHAYIWAPIFLIVRPYCVVDLSRRGSTFLADAANTTEITVKLKAMPTGC